MERKAWKKSDHYLTTINETGDKWEKISVLFEKRAEESLTKPLISRHYTMNHNSSNQINNKLKKYETKVPIDWERYALNLNYEKSST